MSAWGTPDGAKAIKLLGKERLLDDLTLLNRAFGEAKKKHPKLPWGIAQEGIRRCILRDAARVFLEKRGCRAEPVYKEGKPTGLWVVLDYCISITEGLPYDAALVAAVLAAGKEKT